MAASLRRLQGLRLVLAPFIAECPRPQCCRSQCGSVFEVEFSDMSAASVTSSSACAESATVCSCRGLGVGVKLQSKCAVSAWVDELDLISRSLASRPGGLAFGEGLGFFVRGFAAKAKKSGGKSRSDDSGGQAVVNFGPSAKGTAVRLMEAALNALSVELSKLRTGRASPGMLDHVNVISHGIHTPLAHVAAVSVSNLETLTVMPYDPSMVKEVEKAILGSPLRLNPVAEGQVLRVPIPKLTKEHIQSMSKLVGKAGETAKLSIRRARKDAMDLIAKAGLSKDEIKRSEKEVEDVTKKYVKAVEEACKLKEKEILGSSQ